MLGSLGFPEILFILVLALLVFGPKRLPEVGRKVGRAMGEFRRATGDLKRSIDREMTMADMGADGSPPSSTQPRTPPAEPVVEASDTPIVAEYEVGNDDKPAEPAED